MIGTSLNMSAMRVSVDENVEFISAACRLAGYDEYNDNTNNTYAQEIDAIMSPHRKHEAIAYLDTVRKKQDIGCDAIASLAVHTTIQNGHLALLKGADITLSDDRWHSGQDKELVTLLDDLYQCSNFSEFYKSHSDYYSHAISNMNKLLSDCDLEWLTDFLGKELYGSRVVVSLLNRGNYGMTQKLEGQPDESVIIICCNELDGDGYPVFHGLTSLIVHESSHPMCNPLITASLDSFNKNISLAAELMNEELARQAYTGAETMMCESMVRSMELQYALAHGNTNEAEQSMKDQMSQGFIFMPEIREALDIYKADRSTYPSIDSAMPLIVELINNTDVAKRYAEIKYGSPKILGCSIDEDATDIAPCDSLEISFYFNQPIRKGSFGRAYYKDNEDIMPQLADISPRIKVSEDGMTLTMYVEAKPNKEYGFSMNGNFYRGLTGFRGHGTVPVHFFTRR